MTYRHITVTPCHPAIGAEVTGADAGTTGRISGGGSEVSGGADQAADGAATADSGYRGAQGLDPEFIKELERQFWFDNPMHQRFIDMICNFIVFDFGTSFFRDETVIDLVLSKMPVSISLGLWTTLIVYLVCIPLGIRKAVKECARLWSHEPIRLEKFDFHLYPILDTKMNKVLCSLSIGATVFI